MHLPNIHVLHTHYNVTMVVEERAIKGYDVFGVTAVHDLQFAYYALPQFFLGLDMNDLDGALALPRGRMMIRYTHLTSHHSVCP